MNKLPLVSICIPAFNSEKWIKESVKSALDQTWQNKEIIIVDDGSTDNTYSIIKSFESEIVKIYRQENKGSCAARNLAFDKSSGDYIQWLDADDILDPYKIEIQMSYALKDKDPLILYCGKYGKFRQNLRKARFTDNSLWQDLTPYNWMLLFLGDVLMTQPGAWLINRQLIELTGRWNEALIKNQDGEYIFRLVSKSRFIKFTPEAKMYYRTGIPGSISKTYNEKAVSSVFQAIKNCIEILSSYSNTPESKDAIINALNVFLKNNYYSKSESIKEAMFLLKRYNGSFSYPEENYLFSTVKKLFGLNTALYLKNLWWKLKIKTGIGVY